MPGAAGTARAVVLLVDDDRDLREMLRRALVHMGHEAVVASGGAEALRALAEVSGRVDVLLTDVMMPGMNGRELAAAVRAAYPQLPIVVTSGYPEHTIASHGVLDDGVHFVAKPFTLKGLKRTLDDVLGAARAHRT